MEEFHLLTFEKQSPHPLILPESCADSWEHSQPAVAIVQFSRSTSWPGFHQPSRETFLYLGSVEIHPQLSKKKKNNNNKKRTGVFYSSADEETALPPRVLTPSVPAPLHDADTGLLFIPMDPTPLPCPSPVFPSTLHPFTLIPQPTIRALDPFSPYNPISLSQFVVWRGRLEDPNAGHKGRLVQFSDLLKQLKASTLTGGVADKQSPKQSNPTEVQNPKQRDKTEQKHYKHCNTRYTLT
ncbi:uncharacterized protein LOC123959262 [Micropterus dolomieu]|uniref:uncharacterized protein LOC123959262 n=1 Tax=Micropterus dolomieu TaxID=147949 RepID=UPI001E8CF0CD|nr:uncharacterized protein LOC123959262 [Micropterus dolomieu]